MTDSDRDVLRTIIREELHAVLGELETARVRRSAALEELVRLESKSGAGPAPGCSIGVPVAVGDLLRVGGWVA